MKIEFSVSILTKMLTILSVVAVQLSLIIFWQIPDKLNIGLPCWSIKIFETVIAAARLNNYLENNNLPS